MVSIRQLQRHRKRWKARVAQLAELIGVRHEISFAIPWHEAEAALVEAQDMVADLTAAIAAINELQLRKAKITKCVATRARDCSDSSALGMRSSSPSPSPSSTTCLVRRLHLDRADQYRPGALASQAGIRIHARHPHDETAACGLLSDCATVLYACGRRVLCWALCRPGPADGLWRRRCSRSGRCLACLSVFSVSLP